MNQRLYTNPGIRIAGILFIVALIGVLILLLVPRGGKAEEPPVPVPTATAVPHPTETPAFAPTAVSTAKATAMAAAVTATAQSKNPRVVVPSFKLKARESKTITIAPEKANELRLFSFESTGPIKLEILLGGELIFLQTCEVRRTPGEPSKPFTFLDYQQTLEVSQGKAAEFIFTNSCGDPTLEVNANYIFAH